MTFLSCSWRWLNTAGQLSSIILTGLECSTVELVLTRTTVFTFCSGFTVISYKTKSFFICGEKLKNHSMLFVSCPASCTLYPGATVRINLLLCATCVKEHLRTISRPDTLITVKMVYGREIGENRTVDSYMLAAL